ncbi:unnamed protein product [Aphanomyces euteiches]
MAFSLNPDHPPSIVMQMGADSAPRRSKRVRKAPATTVQQVVVRLHTTAHYKARLENLIARDIPSSKLPSTNEASLVVTLSGFEENI